MNDGNSFLGTGWGFPPSFTPAANGVVMTSGVEDIEASLHILLTTRLDERVMRLNYGSNLDAFIFEPLSINLQTLIKDIIENAVLRHEPRIELTDIQLAADEAAAGILKISLAFKVKATNTRRNYVFPYYIQEATDLTK